MKKLLLFVIITVGILTGCNEDMSNNIELAEKIGQANTPHEEAELLEEFLEVLKNQGTPITVEVKDNDVVIPIQELESKLNSNLIVNISFDDGSSIEWKPLDNKNIYLLLRE